MFRLVSKCNRNVPVVLLCPEQVYSTDDNTTWCYEGKGEKTSSFVLVGSNKMTKAQYLPGDTKQMWGLRVKLAYTFSGAGGVSAPIFVSIVGLPPREMPSCQCIIVKLKGLWIGGDGINFGA